MREDVVRSHQVRRLAFGEQTLGQLNAKELHDNFDTFGAR